jgi:pterin-4a-carbinolamine dehydratase
MEAAIDGEKYSLALDNGASFSFVPDDMVTKLFQHHPDWSSSYGAVGCVNI